MLPRLRFFFEQAVLGLWRSLGVTTLAVLTIGIALGLLATFGVAVGNLARVADRIGREVELSAYLLRGTPVEAGLERSQEIARIPGIAHAEYLTSTQAMAQFRSTLGSDAIILEGLPVDVLPPSVEVRLEAKDWTVAEVRGVAAQVHKVVGVEDVRYGQEEIERIYALLGFSRAVAIVVAGVLCMAVILLVSNTIRLTVYARRDEIEIMSLIGATDAFVRAPFVIEGAIQGFLGGTVASIAMFVLEGVLREGIRRGLSYAYGPIELEFVPLTFIGALLLLGVILGLIGSLLAVGKFVKV
ncbi:MAG: permease-like cell division protein FtsX [Myxococcota bacterium]